MGQTCNMVNTKDKIELSNFIPLKGINWKNLTPGEQYDLEHFSRVEDIPFWLKSVHEFGSPIFEIGCGTGRISIPLAYHGFEVFAIDKSEFMLHRLKDKLSHFSPEVQRRLCIYQEDIREFKPSKKFSLVICSFNTFLNMLSSKDKNKFLSMVFNHLTRKGVFILDIINPFAGNLDSAEEWKFEKENYLPNGYITQRYYKHTKHDYDNKVIQIRFKTILLNKKRQIINEWLFNYRTSYLKKMKLLNCYRKMDLKLIMYLEIIRRHLLTN